MSSEQETDEILQTFFESWKGIAGSFGVFIALYVGFIIFSITLTRLFETVLSTTGLDSEVDWLVTLGISSIFSLFASTERSVFDLIENILAFSTATQLLLAVIGFASFTGLLAVLEVLESNDWF